MQDYKQEFIEFALSRNALRFGEFTLKSGRTSPYFFNAGLFNTGSDLAKLGNYYAAALQANTLDYDVIFGPAYKGIPIATATSIALSNNYSINKPVCFNRKEAKNYGEGGNLIGNPLDGKILLVDDVITAGTAIRGAMKLINDNGANLIGVLIALDRQELGKDKLSAIQEVEQDYQCHVYSIINMRDLLQYLKSSTEYKKYLPTMLEYRNNYGV